MSLEQGQSHEYFKSEKNGPERKRLVYSKEIKDFIAEHPRLISNVIEAISELDAEAFEDVHLYLSGLEKFKGERWEKDGLVVETFVPKAVYKVSIDGKTFFVKLDEVDAGPGDSSHIMEPYMGGYEEFMATHKARELFRDQPDVYVPKVFIGYSKYELNKIKKYYVSEFIEGAAKDLDAYLREIVNDPEKKEFHAQLKARALDVKLKILGAGYKDIGDHNLAYDEQNDKIIVFDLNRPNELH